MFKDDFWHRRRKGSGVLLLLFLLVLLGYPLWQWRGLGHPLAGEFSVDLCKRMATVPALAGMRGEVFPAAGAAGSCRWFGHGRQVRLEALLVTTRSAGGMDLARRFDASHKEIQALYGPTAGVRETGDEPLRSLAWHLPRGGERMVEDHGVMLDLRSEAMDDAALDALIEPARAALRTDPDEAR